MNLPRVLVVDDTPANLLAIETILGDGLVDIVKATSGAEALKASLQGKFALILLDVEMPGMNGYEAAGLLRSSARTREIPIIFVTATHSDKRNIFLGYESGAVDYILKPLDAHTLKSKVQVFAELFKLKERESLVQKEAFELEKRQLLLAENTKLNAILNHMIVGVIMAEPPNGDTVFLNRRLAWMDQFDPDQIYRRDGTHIPRQEQMVARALRGETVDEDEVILKLKDGTSRNFLISAMPIRNAKGVVSSAVVSFLDITQRVAAEEAKETARMQLQQAYKMSALGEMAGGIAHEVNNPLAIIVGRSRQLREEIQSGRYEKELLTKFASQIEDTAQRVVKIVNGLKTISRSSDRDPCLVTSLTTLIDGTLAICHAKFKYQSIALHLEVAPNLTIECRAAEISQVLLNLISNALDAVENAPEPWVKLVVKDLGASVEIAVEDSGAGVPEALRDQIMQPFFTTKEVGKGTGLGLSISKGIVDTHGGKFELDVTAKHTRFVLRLPKKQSDAAQTQRAG